jgi:hypothetical protein
MTPESANATATMTITITSTASQQKLNTPFPSTTPTELSRPSWCPVATADIHKTGSLVVFYVVGKDVWLWEHEQKSKRLTNFHDVDYLDASPDGRFIAFTRAISDQQAELWVMNPDGSNLRRLVSSNQFLKMRSDQNLAGVKPSGLTWIPNTHILAFNTYPDFRSEGIWIYIPDDLWTVDTETGKITNLIEVGDGGYFKYSPDGEQIILYNVGTLRLATNNGDILRTGLLEDYRVIGMGESYYLPLPIWSPDGTSITVPNPTSDDIFSPEAQVRLVEINLNDIAPKILSTISAFAPTIYFSVDYTKIAYIRFPMKFSNTWEVHLASRNGQQDWLYFTGLMPEFKGWSQSSEQFIFTAGEEHAPYLGNVCHDTILLVNLPPYGSDVQWITEDQFLYMTMRGRTWTLYLIEDYKPVEIAVSTTQVIAFDYLLSP